jgi:1-acyl-sn-glycerol-3-phosphate acyltransferase
MSRVVGYGGAWEALFPGVQCRVLAASPMFKVPLVRDICLALGAVDAGRKTALRVLEQGLSVHVYPGGSKEVFMTDPADHDRVYLGRKGFVNLALCTGSSLVPVYVFSEKHLYHRKLPSERLRLFLLRVLKFPVLLFYGRFFTLLPLKARPEGLLVAVGKPIPVERVAEPSSEQVDALHAQYVTELKALFERWRVHAGYAASEQLIIE